MMKVAGKTCDQRALNMLVVDDNEGVLTVLERYLSGQGLLVETCRDGLSAADLLCGARGRFDAVLVDIQMPGLNGCELLRHIRDLDAKAHQHTPVLALTGTTELPTNQGFDAILRKPFQFDNLVPRILAAITLS